MPPFPPILWRWSSECDLEVEPLLEEDLKNHFSLSPCHCFWLDMSDRAGYLCPDPNCFAVARRAVITWYSESRYHCLLLDTHVNLEWRSSHASLQSWDIDNGLMGSALRILAMAGEWWPYSSLYTELIEPLLLFQLAPSSPLPHHLFEHFLQFHCMLFIAHN